MAKDRLLRLVVCAVFAFAGGVFSNLWSKSVRAGVTESTIRARMFEVVDSDDKVLARLSTSGMGGFKGGYLEFMDEKDKQRLIIGTNPHYVEKYPGSDALVLRSGPSIQMRHQNHKVVWEVSRLTEPK